MDLDRHVEGGDRTPLERLRAFQGIDRPAIARAEISVENRHRHAYLLPAQGEGIHDAMAPNDHELSAR